MPRSEVFVLSKTAAEIVNSALRATGVIGVEQPVPAVDFATGIEVLNDMVKSWQAQGIHLWKQDDITVFLDPNKPKYELGQAGDFCAKTEDVSLTKLTSGALLGDDTIFVESSDGMTGIDPILLSDPTVSTQDWIADNNAILTADNTGLVVENGAATISGASYELETDVGTTYQLEVNLDAAASTATFEIVEDSVVISSLTTAGLQRHILTWTASQLSANFRVQNDSVVISEQVKISKLNYADRASGDYIGIRLDSNVRQWTTIVEVVSSTEIQLNDTLTDDANISQSVVSFEDKCPRPLRLYDARTDSINQGGQSQIPVQLITRNRYMRQPIKDATGVVVWAYYNPTLDNGELFVWPTASNPNQVAYFTALIPIEITINNADLVDFPSEWFRALKFNLAVDLAPEYDIPDNKFNRLAALAGTSLNQALGWDDEDTSVFIAPNYEGRD